MMKSEAVFRVLVWVARCDAPMSRWEFRDLLLVAQRHKKASEAIESLATALADWDDPSTDNLFLSVQRCSELPFDQRRAVFDLAVFIGTAARRSPNGSKMSRTIPTVSHWVLEFLADSLSGGVSGRSWLIDAYRRRSVRAPMNTNITGLEWWSDVDAPLEALDDRLRTFSRDEVERLKDLWTLGLEGQPSPEEIVQAFRFRARLVHPDRLVSEPSHLQTIGAREFRRLHEAYERLIRT